MKETFEDLGTRNATLPVVYQIFSEKEIERKSSFIIYLDANNLYGWAMIQKLPYGNFNWVEDAEKLTEDDIMKIDAEGDKGYILEVDLEYPESLHDLHNNYPLAPEKIVVNNDMLSPFSLDKGKIKH